MPTGDVHIVDLGLVPYKQAWKKQESYFQELIERKVANRDLPEEEQLPLQHYVLFCEHPHVYTLGRSGDANNLLLDEAGLEKHEATFVKINRGGDITYHGFGQIVGYPIFDLDDFFTDIARYIRLLEEAIILTIAEYGLKGGRIKGLSGVWLEEDGPNPRKICAVGVHLSRWVTMHGFAFNVNTDLTYFKHIIPCGIVDKDKGVTSLKAELGRELNLKEVKGKLLRHLAELFSFEPILEENRLH